MADASMISAALQPVCGFINNTGLPAATARQFSSFFCIKRNWRALTKSNEYLQAFEKVVQEQVTRETNQLNKCHPLVKLWLRRVDGVPSLVDDIDRECDQLMQHSCFCSYSLILRKRYRLGKRVLKTLEDLGELIEQGNQFKVFGFTPLPDLVEERPRIEAFGMTPVLKNLRDFFDSSNVGIIGVWGPGGVGKTTLLNTFNNELKEWGSDYQVVIMIEVSNSEKLNIASIQRVITERLGLPWNDTETEQVRARFLAKVLGRKKFVMLLDDVWSIFQIEEVGIPTPDSESKSKLILTSRFEHVCNQMGAHQSLIKISRDTRGKYTV